jgi:SAM-dependent methyltransferase
MSQIAQRIAALSPEKRRVLEQLLAGRQPAAEIVRAARQSRLEGAKRKTQEFYDRVNDQLNPTDFGKFSFFLNYGYVPSAALQHAVVDLPEHYLNRNSVKLVLELIGDCPLENRRVLDVGCGRGGTLYTMTMFFRPSFTAGLDFSSSAIGFCRAVHRWPGASFLEGDAERLPFADNSFDVVTNVESSHLYPEVTSFYGEVFRVLTPAGHFLYTDLLVAGRVEHTRPWLEQAGFTVERDQDITENVMFSCDQIAARRLQAFQDEDPATMHEFLGGPGSEVYEEMRCRRCAYRMFRLRRSA